MRLSTKAQIQLLELVAVVIVFSVLLVFGLYWFSDFSQKAEVGEIEEVQRLELLDVTKHVMNMPELQCSLSGKTDSTCIDLYRMRALINLLQDNAFAEPYRDRFFSYKLEFFVKVLLN